MSRKKKLLQVKSPPKATIKVDKSLPWLFAGTIFLSAGLLFFVEPMMAKMILPLLGGSPSVWNTCIVFYQTGLLAGYAYAHATSAWLSQRHQLLLHMALVVVPVVILPLRITEDWMSGPPEADRPVIWLLLLLSVSVGLPFFILSASTPMLQKWFAGTRHPAAKDPYFLYAASNLGSMLALLGYPTVAEKFLPVKHVHWISQSWLWSLGYALFIVLVVRCAWVVGKMLDPDEKPRHDNAAAPSSASSPLPRLGILTRLRWVALAFVPSSLMLGVTTYVTLDVAAIPLLWVVPLALYLLSFILVFAKWPVRLHNALVITLPPLLLFLVFQMQSEMTRRIGVVVFFHLFLLFLVALVCHGELALSRPAPRYLTEFYLWLSIGGALGGLFNALVAPAIFFGIVEYELGLVLACLVLPTRGAGPRLWLSRWIPVRLAKAANIAADVALASLFGFLTYKLFQFLIIQEVAFAWAEQFRNELRDNYFVKLGKPFGLHASDVVVIFLLGLPLLLCYSLAARPLQFLLALAHRLGLSIGRLVSWGEPLPNYLYVRRPLLFGLGVGTIMLNGFFWHHVSQRERVVEQKRNFYGVLKVSWAPGEPVLKLTNGTTSHGLQLYHPDPNTAAPAIFDREPLSYYHRTGPIGQVFTEFSGPKAKKSVAVVGLGTGTLASYGEPGQDFLFFDIDLDVVRIARTYFTYLDECRAKWDVIPGDARIRIKLAEDQQFQLIIVDAFNSDAIPVHLLTREALELYLQKLSSDGILAMHISNRYLDLEPVLGNLADALHLVGLYQYDRDIAGKVGKNGSQWVLLARRQDDFGKLTQDKRWRLIRRRPEVGVWTDDYSNLLSVFKWN